MNIETEISSFLRTQYGIAGIAYRSRSTIRLIVATHNEIGLIVVTHDQNYRTNKLANSNVRILNNFLVKLRLLGIIFI